jgi:translocation and assembly module TamB
MRWLRYFLWTLLTLVLLLVGSVAFLVSTQTGLDWGLALAQRFLPGTLSYRHIQGRLIGPLVIQELRYQQAPLDFKLRQAEFDWQPSQLLSARLQITRLRVDGIELHLPPPGPEEPPAEPFTLQDISLPLQISIADIQVSDIKIFPDGAEQPIVINDVRLQAATEERTLAVQTLAVQAPQGNVALDGRLQPSAAYPLTLNLRGDVQHPEYGALNIEGAVQGELKETLSVRLTTTGLATLRLTGEARQVLETPQWSADLGVSIADLSRFSPDLQTGLSAKLETQGSLDDFQASGALDTQLPEVGPVKAQFAVQGGTRALTIRDLRVAAVDHPLSLTAQGHVDLKTQAVSAEADWKQVAWPLTGEPQIQSPQGELSLQGTLQDYRASLKAALQGPAFGDLQAELNATGSDQAVQVDTLKISAPDKALALQAKGALRFAELAFNTQGEWQALAWPLTAPAQVESPTGQFSAEGTAQDYRLRLQADLTSTQAGQLKAVIEASGTDQRLKLSTLSLRAAQGDLALTAQGELGFADFAFQANGEWQALSWPLVGTPQVQSPRGRFQASGNLQDYRFELDTGAQGPNVPQGEWKLQGQGSAEALQNLTVNGKTLEGEIQAKLSAAWQPAVNWQAEIAANGINPGAQWPQAPGKLALQLQSQGGINEGRLAAQVRIVDLSGTLDKQPVKGQGQVLIDDQNLTIETLRLQAGNARLETSGTIKDTWDLRWQLEVPNLAGLVPAARGSVRSSGQLNGPRLKPQGTVDIAAQGVAYADTAVQQLQAKAVVDVGGANPSRLNIEGRGLSVAGQQWQQLKLDGAGTPAQHGLQTEVTGDLGRFNLALTGGLDGQTWQGRLTQLAAQKTQFGDWTLVRPVALRASAEQAGAEALCLASSPTQVCAEGQWNAKTGAQGRVQLTKLTPARFAVLLPENVKIDTELNGEVTGALQPTGALQGNADLRLAPGSLDLVANGQPLQVKLGGGSVQARATGKDANAEVNLDLGKLGRIAGNARLSEIPTQPRVAGGVQAEINDLGLVTAFAPQLQEVAGRLVADVRLSGVLPTPSVQGVVRLEDAAVAIPQLATQIQDVQVTADGDENGQLRLSGSARSGGGNLQLSGRGNPAAAQFELSVKGENFSVADTSAIKVLISPDIQLAATAERINVNGQVVIPKAYLSPPEETGGPSKINPSSDVVIVPAQGTQAERKAGPAVYAKVRVVLGDDVQVAAAGFKGQLKGSLQVEQVPQLAPRGTGTMEVAAGEYRIYGQDLEIERGKVLFSGGPVDNPGLDMRIARRFDDVVAGAEVTGTLKRPRLQLVSTPTMPDSSILSYLLFGRAPDQTSGSENAMLTRAAAALGGTFTNQIASNVGLDELAFESGENPGQTSVALGKYLSPDLYVGYGIGLLDAVNTFKLRYRLSRRLTFESNTTGKNTGADLLYTIER